MTAIQTETPQVVSRAEWLTARNALLQQEKELTYRREEVAPRAPAAAPGAGGAGRSWLELPVRR
jgi:predicted dithiol-disulfide oxidoreductase (DUF899 family)